jgi:cysteinyl-tRNA synthetase
MMRFYNTLSRSVEDFKPQNEDFVSLYTCGPTVYDFAHIGNLRSFVFDDTLRRALNQNYKVKHVMNITDVGHLSSDEDEGEDKLEKGANRERKTVWEVADFYIAAFKKDAASLNILPPNAADYARATAFIKEQLKIVQTLVDKGFAYQTEQAIYFDVTKLSDYGKLTGQKLSDKEVGARSDVVTDPAKHHPQDFAVWFFKVGRFANHSMSWVSPWGEGFPGWHLECSAIIHVLLGEPLDIHTGGVDHIGTHHTNEIAQSEAAFGKPLASYWLHNEHLLVNGKKMAKSSHNFYTLKDVVDKGHNPLALKLLFLQTHYRSQMNFTWESLEAAQANLNELYAWADQVHQAVDEIPEEYADQLKQKVQLAINDDLNTAKALAEVNKVIGEAAPTPDLLDYLDKVFGLSLSGRPDITAQQKEIIQQRESTRQAQDWTKADQLRQRLLEQKIEINDTAGGPIWRRL